MKMNIHVALIIAVGPSADLLIGTRAVSLKVVSLICRDRAETDETGPDLDPIQPT
jgi:hypothetical protein